MRVTRLYAIATLVLLAGAVVAAVLGAMDGFPRGLLAAVLVAGAFLAAWEAIRRRGGRRIAFFGAGVALLAGAAALALSGDLIVEALLAGACLVAGMSLAARVFTARAELAPAAPPRRPVVIWNPRSGGGKAVAANLAQEARARGIEPIELTPGADLEQLVRGAVAAGADGLAAAGGDGTQALVASIAAEHDLPFACIPAGTRNHFALDLGVDRDDVVGALDAFVSGGERRVDLADVNGRTFVNNVSLGLYAEAVQREGYRDAKLRTILDTAPDVLGAGGSSATVLRWTELDGTRRDSAAVILVSNNNYRLGVGIGAGTRPRMDDGILGIAVMDAPGNADRRGGRRRLWRQWTAPVFEVGAEGPVPVGVDGEALVLDPPLRFTVHHGALRLRIAPQHPGASPSAALPESALDGLRTTLRIAAGRSA